jgi:hypothetical protein
MRRTLSMPKLNEPFDVSAINEDAHAAGEGPSPIGPPRRPDYIDDLKRIAQEPKDPDEAVPETPAEDVINPSHYRKHPSGIECIEVTRHMNFNVGNAIKYLWRYMDKDDPIDNLKKAQWYIDDEIRRLQGLR